jgi:DNA-binding response OmpR family regulator
LNIETQSRAPVLVLVEDSPADTYIVRQSLNKHLTQFDLRVFDDGEKAFDFIQEADLNDAIPSPALMLLDLNLPKRSGREVLVRVRNSRLRNMPIVIVTSSDSPVDRAEATKLGAAAYFRKPVDLDEFMGIGKVVVRVLAEHP